MTRTSLKNVNCSVAQFAEILGDKWSLLILRDAMLGVKTFSGFAKNLGVAKNILSERLAHLVEHGILQRQQTRPETNRHFYELTVAGKALIPTIAAMVQWSDEWIYGPGNEPLILLDAKTKTPIDAVRVFSSDGRELNYKDLHYEIGPGKVV